MSAVRAAFAGGEEERDAVLALAGELGLLGWVRADDDGHVRAHLEGDRTSELPAELGAEPVKAEGHEQLAVRGVPHGWFVVQSHAATARHWDRRLEVDGVMGAWSVPKGPSLDPAQKRLAVQVDDHGMGHNTFEGRPGDGGVIVWDHGAYEQGGPVAWP